jgi:hypothetical protein
MRKFAWTLAALAATGSAAWSQSPRPTFQTTDTAVTPKVVLPAKPKVVPQTVPVSYQQTEPSSDAPAPPAGVKMMDIIVPASGKTVGPVKTAAAEMPVPVQKATASRFVPAQRPEDNPPQPEVVRGKGKIVPVSATVEVQGDPTPVVVNGPAPAACNSGCKTGSDHGDKWHALLNWFTYWPKGHCGHPCPPAPYVPHNYTFFLDKCVMAKNLPPLPPPPPAPCHSH